MTVSHRWWGLILTVSLLDSPAAATVLNVPSQYPSIQAAINVAVAGDIVLVAPGSYTGPGNHDIDFLAKSITVRSSGGRDQTVIDCQGSEADPHRGVVFVRGESIAAVLEGFTIKNGYAPYPGQGGAILFSNSSPTIRSCALLLCTAAVGGAAYVDQSSPTITGCSFAENSASGAGAVCCYLSSATFSNCDFSRNTASWAGGVLWCFTNTSPQFTDCSFSENSAATYGGVVYSETYYATPTFVRCSFTRNSSSLGGAVYCYSDSRPSFSFCTFFGNSAGYGGAMYWGTSVPVIENCTMAANSATYRGGAISCGDWRVAIRNTIIAFSAAGEALYYGGLSSPPTLNCCDLFGNAGGDWDGGLATQLGHEGNISVDPLFCDRAAGDLTLAGSSPCLAGHHPDGYPCGLIGALHEGCDLTPVEPVTWGRMKVHF